jgi:hypothetical protein
MKRSDLYFRPSLIWLGIIVGGCGALLFHYIG